MDLEIASIRDETPQIKAFELRSSDGQDLPPFTAGAHIDVTVALPDGNTDIRSYSLAGDPGDSSRYEIAVLHLADGKGGSAFMHSQLKEGHTLVCSDPVNAFPLSDEAHHHVLIAGGIGITPLRAMAYELRSRGAEFEIHYAAHAEEYMAYGKQLDQLAGDRLHTYFSQTVRPNRIDLSQVLGSPQSGRHAYICGPNRLIQAAMETARRLDWPQDAVHVESFGARSETTDQELEVELRLSEITVRVKPGTTILDALIEAGAFVSYNCKRGECSTCQTRVLEGEPIHRDVCLSDTQRIEEQLMCTCISWSNTPRLVLDA